MSVFESDREERKYYLAADWDDEILLPVTKDGFETIMERICNMDGFPIEDSGRLVLAGYVHHIPNEQNTTTLEKLSKVFWKSISNNTTWRIDQDIKQKRMEEAKALADAAKKDQENVLNMPPRPTPSESNAKNT